MPFQPADRHTDKTIRQQITGTDSAAFAGRIGIGDASTGGFVTARFGDAGNFVIVLFTPERIGIEGDITDAGLAGSSGQFFVIDALALQLPVDLRVPARRHAFVHHVDHTANSATAIKQRCRATQYFNLLCGTGFTRHAVIRAYPRRVAGIQTVLRDHHARAIQTADDRATGNGAIEVAVHTDLIFQRVTECRGLLHFQLFTGQHADRQGRLRRGGVQRAGFDINDFEQGRRQTQLDIVQPRLGYIQMQIAVGELRRFDVQLCQLSGRCCQQESAGGIGFHPRLTAGQRHFCPGDRLAFAVQHHTRHGLRPQLLAKCRRHQHGYFVTVMHRSPCVIPKSENFTFDSALDNVII